MRKYDMTDLQGQYAEVNGIRLHYVSTGEGKLIMFVHGFPEFWYEWEKQLIEFGQDYQAVAPDMRGYNLSSKPVDIEKYHVNDTIDDLRALTEHLGHQKCIMVAHDWGGAIAWAAAMRRPEMMEKLIIINSPHPAVFARELLNNPEQQKASQYMLMLRSTGAERVLSENNFAALMAILVQFGSKWEMSEETRSKYIQAWSQPGALTGNLNYYRASPLYPPASEKDKDQIAGILDLPREMLAVKVPTLVIWGEQDQALLTGNLDGLDEYVEDLTVKRIPDGTHWVIHEQPELVNSLIRDFIK
jgi:pimeloyl-ACP methyl ester carboxylesterase